MTDLVRLVAPSGTPVELGLLPGARAGVVLLPEVFGVDDALRVYARQLLARGFSVAMPEWWWRQPMPPVRTKEEIHAAVGRIADPEALADVAAARLVLGPHPSVFVLGFCLGGLYARMAGGALRGFAGVVEFYGRIYYPSIDARKPIQPLDLLPGLSCPFQAHFGADDSVAPPAHVDDLEARLLARPVASQIFRYPGCGHAFMNPGRPAWNAAAAELAWTRATTFLETLSGG